MPCLCSSPLQPDHLVSVLLLLCLCFMFTFNVFFSYNFMLRCWFICIVNWEYISRRIVEWNRIRKIKSIVCRELYFIYYSYENKLVISIETYNITQENWSAISSLKILFNSNCKKVKSITIILLDWLVLPDFIIWFVYIWIYLFRVIDFAP